MQYVLDMAKGLSVVHSETTRMHFKDELETKATKNSEFTHSRIHDNSLSYII